MQLKKVVGHSFPGVLFCLSVSVFNSWNNASMSTFCSFFVRKEGNRRDLRILAS